MSERLYRVVLKTESAKMRLVKASTRAQVASYLTSGMFTIEPATPLDVAQAFVENGKMVVEMAEGYEQ
jgi:hypothetical protein